MVNAAKRYPMMSDHQVIIIKEAQELKWKSETEELLTKYLEHLTPTTILVFAINTGNSISGRRFIRYLKRLDW
ncbi:hypothetical protein [Sphingobacterium sp. E70]|uniref:hypothetical protein n=1 Tax=Sphingobacterium sp. E70 TaxID=2853439 RepID=UPI00359C577D